MGYEDSDIFSNYNILKTNKIKDFTKDLVSKFDVKISNVDKKLDNYLVVMLKN